MMEEIQLPIKKKFTARMEKESYKYLGILEADTKYIKYMS